MVVTASVSSEIERRTSPLKGRGIREGHDRGGAGRKPWADVRARRSEDRQEPVQNKDGKVRRPSWHPKAGSLPIKKR